MAIKYEVIREGEDSDRGPQGEYGVVIVGRDGEHNTGFTGYCLIDHEHSKACAQAILDSAGRAHIEAYIAGRIAAVAARPVHTKAALPKKTITVQEDGKDVQKEVDDRDLT